MKGLAVLLLVSAACAKYEEFTGWKSYIVKPSTPEELKNLRAMAEPFSLDFLVWPLVQRQGVVLVRPEYQELFVNGLDHFGIRYGIHSDNVKAALESEDANIAKKERINLRAHPGRSMPYDNYQRVSVIDQYVLDIAETYSETVTLFTAGYSFERRPIYGLKISTSNFDGSKPVIIIDGTVHAREWISPPTVTYAIHKLTENITEPDLLDNYDWILVPVVNPDGYEFTFTNNRFWRKSRSTDTSALSYLCPGVDLNRNFGFAWMEAGSSSNPCSDTYAGNREFSELESRALRDILLEYRTNTALYITMHSYGSMVLYPWGHNGTLPANGLQLHTVGVAMGEAIDSVSSFQRYVVGNSALVIGYAASGASEDYAYSIGIPLTYTFELPGFSWGMEGFNPAPSLIEPIVQETWVGIVAGARAALSLK